MASSLHIIFSLLVVVTPSLAEFTVNTSAIIEKLTVDFYKTKCPTVEHIVTNIMKKNVQNNSGYIPGILRLHFHDCFVTGCDGSIMMTPHRYNGYNTEMIHPLNGLSLRGLNVLSQIKTAVEKQCPDTVSCTDLLAYAARDAVVLAGNPHYTVPAGRRDGTIVYGNVADDLPKGIFGIEKLTKMYADKGLTVEDLVVLEGSHSIGRSRCLATVSNDANKEFLIATGADKILDKNFEATVRQEFCPASKSANFFNISMPFNREKGDSAWGVSFYDNIMKGKGVIPADLAMAVNANTKELVKQYAGNAELWKKKFNEAMIKVGKMNVLTGQQGEIRKMCGWINAVNMPPQ